MVGGSVCVVGTVLAGAAPAGKLEDFVATWVAKLESWRSHRTCAAPQKYLPIVRARCSPWERHQKVYGKIRQGRTEWIDSKSMSKSSTNACSNYSRSS